MICSRHANTVYITANPRTFSMDTSLSYQGQLYPYLNINQINSINTYYSSNKLLS